MGLTNLPIWLKSGKQNVTLLFYRMAPQYRRKEFLGQGCSSTSALQIHKQCSRLLPHSGHTLTPGGNTTTSSKGSRKLDVFRSLLPLHCGQRDTPRIRVVPSIACSTCRTTRPQPMQEMETDRFVALLGSKPGSQSSLTNAFNVKPRVWQNGHGSLFRMIAISDGPSALTSNYIVVFQAIRVKKFLYNMQFIILYKSSLVLFANWKSQLLLKL